MRRVTVAAVLLVLLIPTGCAWGELGWFGGDLSRTFKADLATVDTATVRTMSESFGYAFVRPKRTPSQVEIEVYTETGSPIVVRLQYLDRESTRVVVRVGNDGNREFSERILEQIEAYLDLAP